MSVKKERYGLEGMMIVCNFSRTGRKAVVDVLEFANGEYTAGKVCGEGSEALVNNICELNSSCIVIHSLEEKWNADFNFFFTKSVIFFPSRNGCATHVCELHEDGSYQYMTVNDIAGYERNMRNKQWAGYVAAQYDICGKHGVGKHDLAQYWSLDFERSEQELVTA